MPKHTEKSEQRNEITYECWHVLSTLLDDIIDERIDFINRTTTEVLRALLDMQETKHWRLGTVEFTRYFQYYFENENGLLAPILSVAEPLDVPFEFTWDTTSYPWTLNLVRSKDDVMSEYRWGKDMRSFDEVSDPSSIVNYIVPKGYGEGVNQLTIKDVNGGKKYLKDDASIAKWGKQPYIWIDRRFKHAESLKASAQALLEKWKEPIISFDIDAADLSVLPEYAQERRILNGVTRIIVGEDEYLGRIVEEKIPDLSKEYEAQYKISNRLDDIADIQADIERKIEVNAAYSQGATNLLNADRVDNADPTHPIKFRIKIPSDAVYVNFMELTWETDYFRSNQRGSEAGGYYQQPSTIVSKSTKGGGGQTTSAGGGQTSSAGGDHRHKVFEYIPGLDGSTSPVKSFRPFSDTTFVSIMASSGEDLYTAGGSGNHTHTVSAHTHTVSDHTHDFEVTLPAVEIQQHTHKPIYGIYEHNKRPSALEIKVDGTVIPHNALQGESVEISQYLQKDTDGKIVRGRFATVELRPTDELAQITANVTWGVFIQSDKGANL